MTKRRHKGLQNLIYSNITLLGRDEKSNLDLISEPVFITTELSYLKNRAYFTAVVRMGLVGLGLNPAEFC